MSARTSQRLGPDDWAAAALDALVARGPDGVAVERLATELGATKGSFYWHFANRAELIVAAVALWERTATDQVIERVNAIPDPGQRLTSLMEESFGRGSEGLAEAALVSHGANPLIQDVLDRVTRRRVSYVADLLQDIGLNAHEAHQRAVVIYASYLGYFQIAHAAPGLLEQTPGQAVGAIISEFVERVAPEAHRE